MNAVDAMVDCHAHIRQYQKRLAQLRRQCESVAVLTALAEDAQHVWPRLPRRERFQKAIVLAARLQEVPTIPV